MPQLGPLPAQQTEDYFSVTEDTNVSLFYDFNATHPLDVSGESVSWFIQSQNAVESAFELNSSNGRFEYLPDVNFSGVHTFRIGLSYESKTTDFIFDIEVNSTQDPPLFLESNLKLPDAIAGKQYSGYAFKLFDADKNDQLTLEIVSGALPNGFAISEYNLIGVAQIDDLGEHNFTVRLNDGTHQVDGNFSLFVASPNTPPQTLWDGEPVTKLTLHLDEDFKELDWRNKIADLSFSDSEQSDLLFSIKEPHSLYGPKHGVFMESPTSNPTPFLYLADTNYYGSDRFTLVVDDNASSNRQTSEIEFVINIAPVNDSPLLVKALNSSGVLPTPLTLSLGEPFSHTFGLFDPDLNDKVSLSFSTLPDWLSFDGELTISGTPKTKDFIENSRPGIFLYLEDQAGQVFTQFFQLTLEPTNYPPNIVQEGPISVSIEEDPIEPFFFNIDCNDSDSDPSDIGWRLLTDANHASVEISSSSTNGNQARVSYYPDSNFSGQDFFEVMTYNLSYPDASDSIMIYVEVNATPDSPIIISKPFVNLLSGVPWEYRLTVHDADLEEELTLEINDLPSWLEVFELERGVWSIQGVPSFSASIASRFSSLVTDSSGRSDAQDIELFVVDSAEQIEIVHQVPSLVTIAEDNNWTVEGLSVNAGEDRKITWRISKAAQFGSIVLADGLNGILDHLTYAPDANFHGSDVFSLEASDGFSSDELTFNITVISVPDATEWDLPDFIEIEDEEYFEEEVRYFDGDGMNTLSEFSWEIGSNDLNKDWIKVQNDPMNGVVKIFGDPPSETNGTYFFKASIYDMADDALLEGNFTIRVNFFNSAPTILESKPKIINLLEDRMYVQSDRLKAQDANTLVTKLKWSIFENPVNGTASIDASGTNLSYTPRQNFNGVDTFVIQVEDEGYDLGRPKSDFLTVEARVSEVEDSAYFVSNPVTTVHDGEKYFYGVEVFDPDLKGEDYPELRFGNLRPDWLKLVQQGYGKAYLEGYPKYYNEGNFSILIESLDSNGEIIQQSFSVEVLVEDYPPEILRTSNNAILEKVSIAILEDQKINDFMSLIPDFSASNPDKEEDDFEEIVWAVSHYPTSGASLVVEGNGSKPSVFSYVLVPDFHGVDHFSIVANEGDRNTSLHFEINVIPQQDSPKWEAGGILDKKIITEPLQLLSFEARAVDADDDSLFYQLVSSTKQGEWLKIKNDNGTAVLHGKAPEVGFIPTFFNYLLRASDSHGNVALKDFEVLVEKKNSPPRIVLEEEPLSILFDFAGTTRDSSVFPILANDADGDSLVWSISKRPSHGNVKLVQKDGRLLKVYYLASDRQIEKDVFTLEVSDGVDGDEIVVHAFLDHRETIVGLFDRLPEVFAGDSFNHEFTIFSNSNPGSFSARILDAPEWVTISENQGFASGWSQRFSISGTVPNGVDEDQSISLEFTSTLDGYYSTLDTVLPILTRDRNMGNVLTSLYKSTHEFLDLENDDRLIPPVAQSIPIEFDGKLVRVLALNSGYCMVGNFRGDLSYSGSKLATREKSSGFLLFVDQDFELSTLRILESTISSTITDAAYHSSGDILIYGHFMGQIALGSRLERSAGQNDLFLIGVSNEGSKVAIKQFFTFGNLDDEVATALQFHHDTVYISGSFRGSTEFGRLVKNSSGKSDGFVAKTKLENFRDFSWIVTMGGSGRDLVRDIFLSNDSLYVVGTFEESVRFGNEFIKATNSLNSFVGRLDAGRGNTLSHYKFNGEGNHVARAVRAWENSGKVVVAGDFNGQVSTSRKTLKSEEKNDLFIMSLDSSLQPDRVLGIGGDGQERLSDFQVARDGVAYLCGTFDKSIKPMGNAYQSFGGTDAFLFGIDLGSLVIRDEFLVQGLSDDRIDLIELLDPERLLFAGMYSPESDLSGGEISSSFSGGHNNVTILNRLPEFKSKFPRVFPQGVSFTIPFKTTNWTNLQNGFSFETVQLPEWVNVDFSKEGGSGSFWGITPSVPGTFGLHTEVHSTFNDEKVIFLHEIQVLDLYGPTFTSRYEEVPVDQGKPLSLSIHFYDHDSDELSVFYECPDWLSIEKDSNGMLLMTGVPGSVDVGAHSVSLRIVDETGFGETWDFVLRVNAVYPSNFLSETESGDGWSDSWFGAMMPSSTGWSYHLSLGWILLKPDDTGAHLWFWNERWGWLWTHSVAWEADELSGHIYSHSLESWLYFKFEGLPSSSLVYLQENQEWVDY